MKKIPKCFAPCFTNNVYCFLKYFFAINVYVLYFIILELIKSYGKYIT